MHTLGETMGTGGTGGTRGTVYFFALRNQSVAKAPAGQPGHGPAGLPDKIDRLVTARFRAALWTPLSARAFRGNPGHEGGSSEKLLPRPQLQKSHLALRR
jgi:hypothetical protein